jgi:hypothetical protein
MNGQLKVLQPSSQRSNTLCKLLFSLALLWMLAACSDTIKAQTYCQTLPGPNAVGDLSQFGNFGNTSGPYFLRIYVHVVRRTDGTGGQTPQQVAEALGFLDADFNPQNIFFVWDCNIDYINNDGFYNSNGTPGIFNVNSNPDGIDIYFFRDQPAPNADGNGRAQDIGATAFYVMGNYWNPPFGSLVRSHVTSHEMGHCLGLYHTFEQLFCLELVDESNCTTCGDLVCDTPADPCICFDLTAAPDCQWTLNVTDAQGDPYDPDETNIMAYSHPDCYEFFSAGQGERMRNTISVLPLLQACLLPSDLITHINSNTLYNTDRNMPGDIYVHSGAELRIQAKIGMRQGTRILVHRNARLVIDNGGIVTKGCDAPDWAGIQVLGNNQKAQPEHDAPLTDPDQAGIVRIDNGTVEWARTGVTAGGGYGSEFWGGVIWTNNNAVFQNNRRDVEFMQYKFGLNLNKSRFQNTKFLEGLPTVSYANQEGITIWETDGIEFDGCDIYSKGMQGIRTYDAGIKVHNGCDIQNNNIGISSYATYPMSYNSVIGTAAAENNFSGNAYDIFASTATGLYGIYNPDGKFSMHVVNNNFEGSLYGVIIDGPSNFRIGGNRFTDVIKNTWVAQTGYNNVINQNLIGCNQFGARRDIGILAIGDNKQMQFLGNDFVGGYAPARDFLLTNSPAYFANGAVRALQGNFDVPAGNCFSDPGVQIDIQTWAATDPFTYYYESGEPPVHCDPEPLNPGNYGKEPIAGGIFGVLCDQFGGLPDGLENPTDGDLNTRRQQLQTLVPSIQTDTNAKVQYYQILAEKEAILKYLVSEALEEKDFTTAEALLAGEQSKAAQWAVFGLRMSRQDYTGAIQLLNQLPLENATDTQFRDIQLINVQRLQNPTGFELSAAQEAYLNSVADGYSPIRGYARGILGLLKDRVYFPDEYEIPEARSSRIESSTAYALKVYPVPASDLLVVTWPALPESADAQIQVFDLLGRQYLSQSVGAKETRQVLGLANLPEGVYFLAISDKGKIGYRAKFTVQH